MCRSDVRRTEVRGRGDLARWNIPVIILDAKRERDPIGSKAIVQQRDVLDVWSAIGAGEQIARDGFLVLTGDEVDTDPVAAALEKATAAPTRVLSLAAVDTSGALREALRPEPGEAWVIRPDAHLAAVVPTTDTARLAEAVQRASGSAVDQAVATPAV